MFSFKRKCSQINLFNHLIILKPYSNYEGCKDCWHLLWLHFRKLFSEFSIKDLNANKCFMKVYFYTKKF